MKGERKREKKEEEKKEEGGKERTRYCKHRKQEKHTNAHRFY